MANIPDEAEMLVSAEKVQIAVDALAAEVQPLIAATETILLGVMNGGLIPLAWLMARLDGDFLVDYCHATRYRGDLSGKELEWLKYPSLDLRGRSIIVVDDIFDEGLTLQAVTDYCQEQGAREVRGLVLVSKRHQRRRTDWRPDFSGLDVDDRYVFGCGMDYRGRWRHLREIYAVGEGQ